MDKESFVAGPVAQTVALIAATLGVNHARHEIRPVGGTVIVYEAVVHLGNQQYIGVNANPDEALTIALKAAQEGSK